MTGARPAVELPQDLLFGTGYSYRIMSEHGV